MNTFIVDRIQTGGAGNLNIPQERVYELGDFQSVGVVRDVPDLSFTLDVLDVGTQVEALLCGSANPASDTLGNGTVPGALYNLSAASVVDIISPFKSAQGAYNVVKGVAVPQLSLETIAYRYGLRQNAGETFTLRGDSIYYVPGIPFLTTATGDGTTTGYTFTAHVAGDGATPTALTALTYTESGGTFRALNVSVNGVRQNKGTDYTEDEHGVTFATAPASGAKIRIVFGANQDAGGAPIEVDYTQAVHADLTVKPAAIRGRDINVYIGGLGDDNKWHDVQSFECDWRVTLDADYEFGNAHAVNRDYVDAPDVTGTIEIKSMTVDALFRKLNQITGVDAADVVGPMSSVTLPIVVELRNPDSGGTSAVPRGTVLKTLFIPDARFTIPGYEGRVSQKLTSQLQWTSDKGILQVVKGAPTATQLGLA